MILETGGSNMQRIKIGDRYVGLQYQPYFVADIAANHDGSLDRAYRLIELAKDAGADAAKFQNFKARKIVSKSGFDMMGGQLSHQKGWSRSVFEVYEEASIDDEWTPLLKRKCDEVGIEYMTSPYDFESVDLADRYSKCIKIGSGDINWLEILKYIAKKQKPVMLATGATEFREVERAVNLIVKDNPSLILMQCNTNYTASPDNYAYINLNVLKTYRDYFPDLILGISDHTYGHATILGAIALGARVIEKHFTDDNDRIGPDHKFSMNPQSWSEMVNESKKLFMALGDGVKRVEENEMDTLIVQRRALYYQRPLLKGETIKKEDIFPVRPCRKGNIPPSEIDKLLGKVLKNDVSADEAVSWEDFL